jgi:hypothetical protein
MSLIDQLDASQLAAVGYLLEVMISPNGEEGLSQDELPKTTVAPSPLRANISGRAAMAFLSSRW